MKTTLKNITSGPPRGKRFHPHPLRCPAHLAFAGARSWTFLWQGPGDATCPTAAFFGGKPIGNLTGLPTDIAYLWETLGGKFSWKLPTDNAFHIFHAFFVPRIFPPIWTATNNQKIKISRLRGGQQQHSISFFQCWASLFFAHCRTVRCCAFGILVCFYHLFLQLTWKPAFGTGFASELWWHQATPKTFRRYGDGVHPFESTLPCSRPSARRVHGCLQFRTEGASGFRA